jgi:hypothetical protein
MPCYTCLTENRGHLHLSQHEAATPEAALRAHIGTLPFIEGINPLGDELYWLQTLTATDSPLELQPVAGCRQAWHWLDGARYSPRYTTHIIRSDVGDG